MQKHGRGWTIFKKNFLAQNLVQHDKIRFQESAYLKQLKFSQLHKNVSIVGSEWRQIQTDI